MTLIRKVSLSTDLDYWIWQMENHGGRTYKLPEDNIPALKSLIGITDHFSPVDKEGKRRHFYVSLPTPSLEEYMKSERQGIDPEDYKYYEVTDKDLKSRYKYDVPESGGKQKWYEIYVYHAPAEMDWPEYVAIWINNNMLITMNDVNSVDERDASDLLYFLYHSAMNVSDSIKAGTYNNLVAEELPYEMRYGTISRKAFWDLVPSYRESFHADLTQKEIDAFVAGAKEDHGKEYPDNCITDMTARKYFEAVGTAMKSVAYKDRKSWRFHETQEEYDHYKGTEFDGTTPREIYSKYADGRDDGLTNVPLDDPDAFLEWEREEGPYYQFNGHHPWEVRTSGSISLSIHIFPTRVYEGRDIKNLKRGTETNKWYFTLSGSAYSSSYEILKYYLALKKHNIPVMVSYMDEISARFAETDNIGFIPTYENWFLNTSVPAALNGMNVTDVESLELLEGNLNLKKREWNSLRKKLLKEIEWLPVPEVNLI